MGKHRNPNPKQAALKIPRPGHPTLGPIKVEPSPPPRRPVIISIEVPEVAPVPPPERPVRVIHDGHTVKIPKPIVLVDVQRQADRAYTFERFPRWFAGVERATLRAGRYTIKGMERRLAIEQMSLADLVGSTGGGRSYFLRRCESLAAIPRKVIVIEGSLAQTKSHYPRSMVHPNAVVGTLVAVQERWGIQVLWCDDQELAEEMVAHILSKHYTLIWLKKHNLPRHFVDGDV